MIPTDPAATTTPAGGAAVVTVPVVGPVTDAEIVPDVIASDEPVALAVSFANDPGDPSRSTPNTAAATAATAAYF
jgi:uncharacterized protein (DUF39 family)